jgi:hypothetical protein
MIHKSMYEYKLFFKAGYHWNDYLEGNTDINKEYQIQCKYMNHTSTHTHTKTNSEIEAYLLQWEIGVKVPEVWSGKILKNICQGHYVIAILF